MPSESSKRSRPPETSSGAVLSEAAADVALSEPVLEELPQSILVDLRHDDVNTVLQAMQKLEGLMQHAEHKTDANLMGSPGVIVGVMRKWQQHRELQQSSCCTLARLAYNNVDGAVAMAKSGGLEAVLDAMRLFPNLQDVQDHACAALLNVMMCGSRPAAIILPVVVRWVERLNGLQAIVRAMQQFPNHGRIQKNACAIFFGLSLRTEFHSAIHRANAVSQVAKAIEYHPTNEKIKAVANSVLFKMLATTQTTATAPQVKTFRSY